MAERIFFDRDGQLIEVGFSLSPRLVEVLGLRLRQLSVREIAGALVVEPSTAAKYLAEIHSILGVHTRRELFEWAEAAGLVQVDARLGPGTN